MSISQEQAADAGYIELLLDGDRGIYLPRDFCDLCLGSSAWSGYNKDDVKTVLNGPDNEWYWEAWQNILDSAVYTDPETGDKWFVYQDDSLFAVRADIDIDWELY